MQIAQVLGGYSLGRADLLAGAMGKKKADLMAQERSGFVEGCAKNGVDVNSRPSSSTQWSNSRPTPSTRAIPPRMD